MCPKQNWKEQILYSWKIKLIYSVFATVVVKIRSGKNHQWMPNLGGDFYKAKTI